MNTASLPATQPMARVGLFSLRGRLGRARYITYSLGTVIAVCVSMLLVGFALILAGSLGQLLYKLIGLAMFYGFLPLLFVILTIRRAHDFNRGGWVALLLLIPIVNVAFWFIPGTRGENTYGAQPEEASLGVKIAAFVLPTLLIGGFLASDEKPLQSPTVRPASGSSPAQSSTTQPSTKLKPYIP